MLTEKLVHYNSTRTFEKVKLSADPANSTYCLGLDASVVYTGSPDIAYDAIVFVKDRNIMWTHGKFYADGGWVEI